jgi:tRNA threonylcarbamoyladenosine biosynthesis protein TsaE
MKNSERHWKLIDRWDISKLSDLAQYCQNHLTKLPPNAIVLLQGPMAAGKSEMVRQLMHALDSKATSSSPTYALHHRYQVQQKKIDHWDLHRLSGEDELESSGFWDLLASADSTVFIEWAEKLKEEWLPRDRAIFKIDFEVHEHSREISVYQAA